MTMSRCAISRAEHGTTRIPGGTGIGGCEKSSTKKRENIGVLTTIQVAGRIYSAPHGDAESGVNQEEQPKCGNYIPDEPTNLPRGISEP
jgi:hypothetical protein